MNRFVVAIIVSLFGLPAIAQSERPTLHPINGATESLPLRVIATSGYKFNPPSAPCQSGGITGNFTVMLNCDGNDSDGSASYEPVPDTDLAVGDQYYIQTVDNVFTIFNKIDGSVVLGPDLLTTFWKGFHNQSCLTAGSGDDFIIRYDKAASRWLAALPVLEILKANIGCVSRFPHHRIPPELTISTRFLKPARHIHLGLSQARHLVGRLLHRL